MVVAKRQGREKPAKIEQRKVQGLERGPQVELNSASPFTQGRPRVAGESTHRRRSPRAGGLPPSLSLLFMSLGSACPQASRVYFPVFSK